MTAEPIIEEMTERQCEHLIVADQLSGADFTLSQLRRHYRQLFPERPANSIMPYEFCYNRHPPSEKPGPRFMVYVKKGVYRREGGGTDA